MKLMKFNEYKIYLINEKDGENEDSMSLEDIDKENTNANDDVDDSVYVDSDINNGEDVLFNLKSKIDSIFSEENEIGTLDDIEMDNNYTSSTLKFKYNDGEAQYNCYIRMPFEDMVKDTDKAEKAEFKMIKYIDGKIIGQIDKAIKISEIDDEFLVSTNAELNDKYSLDDKDDLGLEFNEE